VEADNNFTLLLMVASLVEAFPAAVAVMSFIFD
jgi:hypothetical protein